jgi:hypothetical protein
MALASLRMVISSRADFALSVVKKVYETPVMPARCSRVCEYIIEKVGKDLLLYAQCDEYSLRNCSGNHSSEVIMS